LLIKKISIKSVEVDSPKDGNGKLIRWDYLKDNIPCSRFSMFSYLELEPGASIGKHQHSENFEVYYFLDGEGMASDNDDEVMVRAGDMLLTECGSSHALRNTGEMPLKFIAFIMER
jgi:mannose-6-phosphate isomerase-like protein (cupin superfamily)